MKVWLQLAHAIDVHNRRAMDPQEGSSVEHRKHLPHRFANKMDSLSGVNPHRISSGFDPVNLRWSYELDTTVSPHRDARRIRRTVYT
jgi:hypothetical protein